MKTREHPKVALALSGGTAKSVAHVGVLEALLEARIPIDYLAGTSGGAMVGAVYAAGFSIQEMKEIAGSLRWRDLARLTLPKLGLLNNSGVERLITDLLGDITFADLRLPLAIVGTDLLTGEKRVFTEGKVAAAVQISTSIPTVFQPVDAEGTLYVDGGLVEYMPVETARDLGGEIVIGVNLGHRHGRTAHPRNLLHVAMAVTGIAAQQNARISTRHADLVIVPPTSRFPSFDLMASGELIEVGYEAAKARIPDIRACLESHQPPRWIQRLKFWER
jgi:NTE family protein